MVQFKAVAVAILLLAAVTIGGAQAYFVRELAPGWPPLIHPHPKAPAAEVIQIPVERIQHIGVVLVLAIVCLAGVALGIGGKSK